MAVISMKQLLQAGVHFGHQTRRWNPKMAKYIFTERNGIHVIDLQQTVKYADQAYDFMRDAAANDAVVLFVGTKKQAADAVAEEAVRSGQYYINHRWLGGTLTNWRTVSGSIARLRELEGILENGGEGRVKKELLNLQREKDKLELSLGGIKDMGSIPDIMFVIDTNKEAIAIQEARKLNIPVIAILDTNCDPDQVNYPIPGNDDAIRSAALLTKVIASAVAEGLQARSGAKTEAEGAEPLAEWEQELLAGATAGTDTAAAETAETTTTES